MPLLPAKKVPPNRPPQHLGPPLVHAAQLLVGRRRRRGRPQVVRCVEAGAPEGAAVGVDGVVGRFARQAVGGDVVVCWEVVCDCLVELGGWIS